MKIILHPLYLGKIWDIQTTISFIHHVIGPNRILLSSERFADGLRLA